MKERSSAVYKHNKFYVGSRKAIMNSWGHAKLDDALKHASELVEETGEEQFVVRIIRVVKHKTPPVVVEKV